MELIERRFRKMASRIVHFRDGYSNLARHKKKFTKAFHAGQEKIENTTLTKLRNILLHAYTTTSYYKRLWGRYGFDPSMFNTPADLSLLPFLTKEIIEQNRNGIISDKYHIPDLVLAYTGGSSGTHTSFYRDRECTVMRMGRQTAILELLGFMEGSRCGLIWGIHDDLLNEQEGFNIKAGFRKFASGKETLSCAVMNDDKMMDYYKRLKRFKPTILYGYPNAMTYFASFVKSSGLDPIQINQIFCTAERLYERQKQTLKEVFGGEVFNLYCTREHGCIGFECNQHQGFHIDTGSVYLEVVPKRGAKGTGGGDMGDIVITDLLNYGMPLIRNKTGDLGSFDENPCPCGCHLPLLKTLDGRETDMLHRPDGKVVSGVMLVDMFLDEPAIKAIQVVQDSLYAVKLNLVITEAYNRDVECRAVSELQEYMGDEVTITTNIVDEIPRNPLSGKYQEVLCKVKTAV